MRFGPLLMAVAFTAFCLCANGQPAGKASLRLRFVPVIGANALKLEESEAPQLSDTPHITLLRCYISGIALWKDGKEVWREAQSYHLLDAAEPERLTVKLDPPAGLDYDRVHFSLGIDSATSCSGAHGGDLDPVKGMYWAWQSGYINFKLEGQSLLSPARKHLFQFHLGGYQAPYASIQPVVLAVRPAPEVIVRMDLAAFLDGLDLSRQHTLMIPGPEALTLSKRAAGIFQIR